MRIPSWGQRRRDEKAGASRRRRRMRLRRRRRRQQGGGRQADAGGFRGEMLRLHNQAKPGSFRLNGDLCESAQARAEKMAREGRMYHEPDWWKRIEQAGYHGGPTAENLAIDFDYPEEAAQVMKAWLNSLAHRRNVMGPYGEIGIGYADGCWCIHFGG